MSQPDLFQTQRDGPTLVVAPIDNVGSLESESIFAEMKLLLEQLEDPDLKNVILDFNQVNYFGSSMLGMMHAIWKQARSNGGKVAACNVNDVGREILEVSRFDHLWEICTTRQEAIDAVLVLD